MLPPPLTERQILAFREKNRSLEKKAGTSTCLELVLLDVGPEPLNNLRPAELLPLLGSDDLAQLGGERQRLCQSGSLRHDSDVLSRRLTTGVMLI